MAMELEDLRIEVIDLTRGIENQAELLASQGKEILALRKQLRNYKKKLIAIDLILIKDELA